MKKKRFVIIDFDAGYFSFGNIFRVLIVFGLPFIFIVFLYGKFYEGPKQRKEEIAYRKSFIQDVSYRDVVIGKEEVGDYRKSYMIEYKDTFFIEKRDELVYDLFQAVEKGDTVIKEKGNAFYTVIRKDSVFKVGI